MKMPLLWLSLALIGGLALADVLKLPVAAWLGLAAGCAVFAAISGLGARSLRRPAWLQHAAAWAWQLGHSYGFPAFIPLLACAACLGGARYQADHPPLDSHHLAVLNDQPGAWVVRGRLAAPPDRRDGYTNLLLQAEEARSLENASFEPTTGLLLARLEPAVDWQYQDRVEVRGELVTPEAGEIFSYQAYLARRGILSLMPRASARRLEVAQEFSLQGWLYQVQAAALTLCYRLYPDPESGLTAGVLLGADRGLPPRVTAAFQASGIAHVLAISGFNITILAGVFLKLAGRAFGRWRGALLAGVGITAYTLMTGAEASAVRAAWMGGLALLAAQIGRRQDGLNSLGAAAGVMAWIEPDVLWDVGFQLSFASTLGLVVLGGPLSDWVSAWLHSRLPTWAAGFASGLLADYVLITLAAQLFTLPLMIAHFQRLSLVALAANFVALPVQPALMILSGLSVLAGFLWQPFGQILAYLAWPLARYTILSAEFFAALPGAQVSTGPLPGWWVVGIYCGLVAFYLSRERWAVWLGRIKPLLAPSVLLLLLGAAALTAWRAAAQAPDGRLHLVMLDINAAGRSGEAFLIQTPGGRFVLVNGGPSSARLGDSLGQRLPLFDRRLDWLVVAGVNQAQIEALPDILPRYPAGQVLWAGPTHDSQVQRSLFGALQAAGVPITPAVAGHSLDLGQGAQLHVLYCGPKGGVLLLEWRSFRTLLPLGIDDAGLQTLQGGIKVGRVSVVALAHGGAAADNPSTWTTSLQPKVVLLSISAQDVDGRPDAETLQAWQGYQIIRTDQSGWIEVTTDGNQMWLQTERK